MYDFTCVDAHVHPFFEAENNIAMYESPTTAQEMVDLLKAAGHVFFINILKNPIYFMIS